MERDSFHTWNLSETTAFYTNSKCFVLDLIRCTVAFYANYSVFLLKKSTS